MIKKPPPSQVAAHGHLRLAYSAAASPEVSAAAAHVTSAALQAATYAEKRATLPSPDAIDGLRNAVTITSGQCGAPVGEVSLVCLAAAAAVAPSVDIDRASFIRQAEELYDLSAAAQRAAPRRLRPKVRPWMPR